MKQNLLGRLVLIAVAAAATLAYLAICAGQALEAMDEGEAISNRPVRAK